MLQFSFCSLALLLCCIVSSNGILPLRVLVLVPFPNLNGTNGWDRGLELLPAARVAVREINNNSDLLAGYEMQLIERSSDACGESIVFQGLTNFVDNAIQITDTNAIAVLGLACSTTTASVSPIAGREEVSLLQLAMANSNILRNKTAFPHLWRFLSTSDGLVSSAVALLERFSWTRVGLIYDQNVIYLKTIADTFRERVKSKNYTVLIDQGIDSSSGFATVSLDLIQTSGVRIIFVSTTILVYIEIMCQAAEKNLVWPQYVWIFPSYNVNEFYSNSGSCDREDLLLKAIENVILIDFDLVNRNRSAVLVSGRTYEDYIEDYYQESNKLQKEERFIDLLEHFNFTTDNPFANLMYNEVWALALAINNSLPDLMKRGFLLQNYKYNNSEMTNIIEGHLEGVSFPGILGTVAFDRHREVKTMVGIYQIREKQEVEIATLQNGILSLLNISDEDVPSDDFGKQYNPLDLELVVVIYIQAILLTIFVTLMLCLVWILRKQPEVRATSPLLSTHIFLGCFLLIVASVFLTIRQFIQTCDSNMYVALCYLSDAFANTGINLITATVLMRLVRVYRIFTTVTRMGNVWKNNPIFISVTVIAFVPNIVTVVQVFVDPKECLEDMEYLLNKNPPVMDITIRCFGKYAQIFDILKAAYTMLLMLLLLVFALLTRNVAKKNFKDTKKVTAFVFSFTLFGTIFIPVSYILKSIGNENAAVVVLLYMHHLAILLSQLFLIAPKVIPTCYYRYCKNNLTNNKPEEDMTISNVFVSPMIKKLRMLIGATID